MATCDQTRLLLGPFDDGELEAHEMEDVALHVVNCVGCKATLEGYRTLGVALRGAVTIPALDGFADAVQAHVKRLRVPFAARVSSYFDSLMERFGALAAIGATAAVAAALTAFLLTPYARHLVGAEGKPVAAPHETIAATVHPAVPPAKTVSALNDLSKLEAQSPSVAFWNEPRTDTTVIWVPDQP
jgi:anti-sigma factor RsiW